VTDEDPPPPKRRRKPPKGLEGFETGLPDEAPVEDTPSAPVESPRKRLWAESQPAAAAPIDEPRGPGEASLPVEFPVYVPDPTATAAALEPAAPVPAEPAPASAPIAAEPARRDGDDILPQHTAPDLREAVGAKPKKKRRAQTPLPVDTGDDFDDETGGRRSRKMIAVSIASLVVGLGVAALVFLGRANSAWFYISCEPDKIVAERGRAFPPWGETALAGKQWAAIKIPPEAECIPLETEDEAALAVQFRTMLVKRASVLLTAKEVTKTDEAKALLEQALLHARANTDDARTARGDIQRLLGDVVYWRASLKLRDASKTLLDAAKEFDAAAQQRPRHVTDASAWAEYVRKIVTELEAGPAGTTQTSFPPAPPPEPGEPRPPAPAGVALPVEPGDAGVEAPPAPPDAGIPTGGVLL
jgi:hypothetical protein